MNKKFFFSDLHLGQWIDARNENPPVDTIEEWDEFILDAVNSTVQRKDYLYILGDFCDPKRLHHYRQRIQCRHIRVARGNHDASLTKLREVFGQNNVEGILTCKIAGTYTMMSHYPMCYWDKSHHGSWHLHGHCHDNRSETIYDAFPGWQGLDVGPESANSWLGKWKPFSEDEVIHILKNRNGHDKKDWYDWAREVYRQKHLGD